MTLKIQKQNILLLIFYVSDPLRSRTLLHITYFCVVQTQIISYHIIRNVVFIFIKFLLIQLIQTYLLLYYLRVSHYVLYYQYTTVIYLLSIMVTFTNLDQLYLFLNANRLIGYTFQYAQDKCKSFNTGYQLAYIQQIIINHYLLLMPSINY